MQPGLFSSFVSVLAATALLASSLAAQVTRQPGGRVVVPPGVVAQPAPPPPTVARPTTPVPVAGTPCCSITALSESMVTAVDSASGDTFQFRVNDRAVLRTLAVGGPVWADLAAGRAGLRANVLCCAIVTGGGLAGGGRQTPPVQQPPAGGVTGGGRRGSPTEPVRGAESVDGRLAGGAAGQLQPVVADPGYKVLQRTPVPFRAFAASELGPGATSDRQITLPNRRRLTVAAYLAEINAVEERLNGIGYSLRDLGDSPEEATVIEEPVLTRQQLATQSSAIASAHLRRGESLSVDQAASASEAKFKQSFAAGRAGQAALTQALAGRTGGAGAPHGIEKSWGLPIGDPNSVWVSLDGDFALDGNAEGTTMALTQRARGSVLDHDLEFLSMTGKLGSQISEPGLASLEFRVLGNTIPVFNEVAGTDLGLSKDGVTNSPINWSFTIPLSVGGVGMDVEFTVGGLAGVQYYVGVGGGSVVGVVTPFVAVEASADIEAINLDVVDSGVSGELVIVDDRLVIAGQASLLYDNVVQEEYVYFDYLVVNDFVALQGDLNVYVCAYVISNWQPKKKCWRKYLWKEDGIDFHDTLFMGNEKVYID